MHNLNDDILLNIFYQSSTSIHTVSLKHMVMRFLCLICTKHVGVLSSCMSANDGGASYLLRQFASASILFARIAHLWLTCWHTPPPSPLSLILHYCDTSAEEEEAILFALQYPGRVHRIGLMMPAASLLKTFMAMDKHFSVLECLFIWPRSEANISLMLPARSQEPQLRNVLTLLCSPSHAISVTHSATSVQITWYHGLSPCPSWRAF